MCVQVVAEGQKEGKNKDVLARILAKLRKNKRLQPGEPGSGPEGWADGGREGAGAGGGAQAAKLAGVEAWLAGWGLVLAGWAGVCWGVLCGCSGQP